MSDQRRTPADRLTPESARALFERDYELLNDHDARHIPTVFTEDVEFKDDAWPETVRGHEEMERFLTTLWRGLPDFRFELLEGPYLSEDGQRAAARVGVSGTMTGPLDPPGYAPTDNRIATEFGGFYEFDGDRLKCGRVILNMRAVGAQIGAVPAPGSRGERLGVVLRRLAARRMRRRARD